MKKLIKNALFSITILSLSSVYAQEPANGPINTSRSNIRTNREVGSGMASGKQPQGATFGEKATPTVTETEEGWDFKNVMLSSEEIDKLIATIYPKAGPLAGISAAQIAQTRKLLENGNFFVTKESLNEKQKQVVNVLKTKHDTAKNAVNNIR